MRSSSSVSTPAAEISPPLRLNFQASPERIARLEEEKAFQALAQSKKKGAAGAREQAEGRVQQEAIRVLVRTLPDTLYKDREAFESLLAGSAGKAGVKLAAPIQKAILSARALIVMEGFTDRAVGIIEPSAT